MDKKSNNRTFLLPQFSLFDIQIGVGEEEFKKGYKLFNDGKVGKIKSDIRGFSAAVAGAHPYEVFVEANDFDQGSCSCYLGQKDILCKHMIALAIAAIFKYNPENFKLITSPLDRAVCSGQIRDITKEELVAIKKELKHGLSYIKYYDGPSSKWFTYQDTLLKGGRLMRYALSKLPICEESAKICIDFLVKLDKKVCNGVDDSDGTVGELMTDIVEVLNLFVSNKPDLRNFISEHLPKETSFGWERMFGVI
ncbi:MAG: SWIM zinc finger family protein [Candidatus Pacebacteria bacterium]|nr:SWIM zinc finger family protein [Candidatus Paceibacterota bacterium]